MFRKSLARKKVQNIQKHFPAAAKVSPKSHRSAPYFPPNPLISPAPGTQTVITTIGFHFLCNWTRNGAGDKKGTFSNTCYLVFQQRRARQRLWFVQFAKFAKHCLPPKSCEPANAILPFPFRPPAALPSHRTFISISTFLCPLVCSYPFQVPRNSGQNGETLFRLSLDLLSVEFYFWGNLLRGMVVRKFPILVLSVFSWETWQKRLIGFPSMAVNNQSQMREAGQHCFLRGGVWGCGGSWCENRASSSYQLFYSRPASARLTRWTVGWERTEHMLQHRSNLDLGEMSCCFLVDLTLVGGIGLVAMGWKAQIKTSTLVRKI